MQGPKAGLMESYTFSFYFSNIVSNGKSMQGMNPMMAARMQMLGGQPGMGMNGLPGPQRGPVPPPKPPPRTPPSRPNEAELMQMMMKMRSGRAMSDLPRSSEEEFLMRALEMSRGRSPRRDRRYRYLPLESPQIPTDLAIKWDLFTSSQGSFFLKSSDFQIHQN